jgi:hypothetical protein
MTEEHLRLQEARAQKVAWKKWGPYLSERQWGTVREDYSVSGNAWDYFSHDQARSRAHRWGEDGLGGIADDQQLLCFALALWNGADPILKERLFGLTNGAGTNADSFALFDTQFATRRAEADQFYHAITPDVDDDVRNVLRQALAGMLWSKQHYSYDLAIWLKGQTGVPIAAAPRANARNRQWIHMFNNDIISMPDKWEYPCFAAWDLAFHYPQ